MYASVADCRCLTSLWGCRIAEVVCGKIAKNVLKQRPNTVQRGSDILLTMIELGQADAVVVRPQRPKTLRLCHFKP